MKSEYTYIHDYGIHVDKKQAHIYLFGESTADEEEPGVEYLMANRFIKNLHIAESNKLPVTLHLKTCGGFWEEGMAIYDAIKTYPYEVTAINYTHARSMSSLIFLACDKRVMMPHSVFMFHMGTENFTGTVKQCQTELEQLEKSNVQMIDIYVDHLYEQGFKDSKKKIRNWVIRKMNEKEDVYFSAEEAVEIGFADEIRE